MLDWVSSYTYRDLRDASNISQLFGDSNRSWDLWVQLQIQYGFWGRPRSKLTINITIKALCCFLFLNFLCSTLFLEYTFIKVHIFWIVSQPYNPSYGSKALCDLNDFLLLQRLDKTGLKPEAWEQTTRLLQVYPQLWSSMEKSQLYLVTKLSTLLNILPFWMYIIYR